jgi:hypothetical protein
MAQPNADPMGRNHKHTPTASTNHTSSRLAGNGPGSSWGWEADTEASTQLWVLYGYLDCEGGPRGPRGPRSRPKGGRTSSLSGIVKADRLPRALHGGRSGACRQSVGLSPACVAPRHNMATYIGPPSNPIIQTHQLSRPCSTIPIQLPACIPMISAVPCIPDHPTIA